MTYRVGGAALFYSGWELLDEEEKVEARVIICDETLTTCKKGAVESQKVIEQRLEEMGMQEDEVMIRHVVWEAARCGTRAGIF